MVLIKNNGEKDVNLAWGQWNYEVKVGEKVDVPAVVAQAIEKRFENIEKIIVEVKEIKPIIEKPVEVQKEETPEVDDIVKETVEEPKSEIFSSQEGKPLESEPVIEKKTRRRRKKNFNQ